MEMKVRMVGLAYRAIGRSARPGVAVLLSAFGLAALTLGCQEGGPLSENEMNQLRALTIARAALPTDLTNAMGDDPGAARLGKLLFFDTRFSGALGPSNVVGGVNGSLGAPGDVGKIGCASCHDPTVAAGADHRSLPDATSLGAGYTPRNAPTVINAAYAPLWQFWDGRKDSLWSQALSPPEGVSEGNTTRLAVVHLLYDKYRDLYAGVFGAMPDVSALPPDGKPGDPTFDGLADPDQATVNQIYANFGKAIAAYERRLVSPAFTPSPFDSYMAGDDTAMTPGAIRGARLFVGHAGCTECHMGPLLTDFGFHNIGVPQEGEYVPVTDDGRLDGVSGLAKDPFNRAGDFSDDKESAHLTAFAGTLTADQQSALMGKFKTPSLRNVGKTAPYMHDGAYQSLWDVVNHYNFGGETGLYVGTKDPAISPLLLSNDDLDDLVEFLSALDDGGALTTADFPEGLTTAPMSFP
jgi:cytochrome c peroxidase